MDGCEDTRIMDEETEAQMLSHLPQGHTANKGKTVNAAWGLADS